MSIDPRRRVPLKPSYAPLSVVTNRRIYIQNLVNILHLSILKRDWERAYRAWAILIRCPEVDYKDSWHWGLSILGHLPPYAYSSPDVDDDDKALERSEKKEIYLRRLMSTVQREKRPDILQTLVLNMIQDGHYGKALEELDLYLPSYPYISSASLHTYAGLLCFWLALPASARGPPVGLFDTLRTATNASHPAGNDVHAGTVLGTRAESERSVSQTPEPAASSTDRSLSPPALIPPLDHSMDKAMLRRAVAYFQSSVDIDEGAAGISKGENDEQPESTSSGLAASYLTKLRQMLLLSDAPPDQEDVYQSPPPESLASHLSQTSIVENPDTNTDGLDDEDRVLRSETEESDFELDAFGNIVERKQSTANVIPELSTNKKMKKGMRGDDDDDDDDKSEYSDVSFD